MVKGSTYQERYDYKNVSALNNITLKYMTHTCKYVTWVHLRGKIDKFTLGWKLQYSSLSNCYNK